MLFRALFLTASSTLGLATAAAVAVTAPQPAATQTVGPCTTGSPTVTAGYTINYAEAKPTIAFEEGYQPEPAWADSHVIGTYTFGVPTPVESGFAYAQFKCQYYCNNAPGAGGFFVSYTGSGSKSGSDCTCFDELLDPESFVSTNQTLVGAWNPICKEEA
ncbi:hypothetical protein F5X99DRAFT_428645 [Biscogniauxia marginata]|nr:hypothetical protein F5X99DRAFT_428645 [Biscogniauxia marginata]